MNAYTVTDISNMFHEFNVSTKHNNDQNRHREKKKYPSRALLLACNNITCLNLQRDVGTRDEKQMIDLYEHMFGCVVAERNEEIIDMYLTLNNKTMYITGKIDGFVHGKNILIEHKRRTRGLLHYVPFHEKVQCYMYMRMIGCKHAHLVESFGHHILVHTITFRMDVWKSICEKLSEKFKNNTKI